MDKKTLKEYSAFAIITVIVCYIVKNFDKFEGLLSMVTHALLPLTLGFIIAYIFNIILGFFEKKYFPKSQNKFIRATRRPVCLVISFLCAVGIIVLVLNIVIPEIINALKLITAEIPPLFLKIKDFTIAKLDQYPDIQQEAIEIFNEFDFKSLDWTSITSKAADFIQNGFMGIITSAMGIVGAVTGTATNIIIAVIFAIYLLLRKDKLLTDINRLGSAFLSEKVNRRVNHVCKTANDTFQNFFIGQFVEAILLGCLCFIGMTILRLPYAAMSGTLVGVTALIPVVGAFLGAGISAFIIFTESPTKALFFLIFLVILQQFDNNIIYPKIVGDSVGLPGIWVLAAVTLGASFGGIVGMIVAVPLTATVYKLAFETLEARERKLGIAKPAEPEMPKEEKKVHKFRRDKNEPEKKTEPKKETAAPPKQTASKKSTKNHKKKR